MPLLPMQITQVEFRLQELVTNFISSVEEGAQKKREMKNPRISCLWRVTFKVMWNVDELAWSNVIDTYLCNSLSL
jgi:hypothetical protein